MMTFGNKPPTARRNERPTTRREACRLVTDLLREVGVGTFTAVAVAERLTIYLAVVFGRQLRKVRDRRAALLLKLAKYAGLPAIVRELCERLELSPCTFRPADDEGDCGNWDFCGEDCALANLRRLVGIVPQEDGGIDKQPEATP